MIKPTATRDELIKAHHQDSPLGLNFQKNMYEARKS